MTCASSTLRSAPASARGRARTRSSSPARRRQHPLRTAGRDRDAEVEEVASRRHRSNRARFEEGLLHPVREGGSGLSAGERQLISIARALLADPRILIFDEATSNIDRPTEILIEQALDRLLRGRTSIIIAHRLATVRRADEILVVEHGRITQRGRFDDSSRPNGPFRRLARDLEARRSTTQLETDDSARGSRASSWEGLELEPE
jgi:ABC-type transport system involved in cytochrome bd biosynthesis fused ATPase/permease subunit